jgi:gluconolactonase
MGLEVKSKKLLDLIDEKAEVEKIATGFQFTEGPIWHPKEKALYFSDMPMDVRRRWSADEGVEEVKKPANKCNGMTLDDDLNLIVCEHSTSLLVRETTKGERQVLASHYNGKELNSPNDVVVKSDGAIYFSDPTYGRMPVFGEEREQQLDFQGVYRIDPKSGELGCMMDDFEQPNGLCFSPDEKILYINDTGKAHIRVFQMKADGSFGEGRVFAEGIGTGTFEGGLVDGMKCDRQGNVYVTGPRGIWVFAPSGENLGVIRMPEHAGNLNWGGDAWDELYCACSTSMYRVKLKVSGNRLGYMR